jgi:hypothetical protein
VERAVASGELPVLVLDVDSTLIDTSARQHRILREFARVYGDRFPGVVALVDGPAPLAPAQLGYDVRDRFAERGLDDPELLELWMRHWGPRFFHSAYCRDDVAVPGAVAFARAAHEAGAFLWYLTARPTPTMGEGTVGSLMSLGFPLLTARTLLQLKERVHRGDASYKGEALDEIERFPGRLVATFENEPGNAHLFLDRFPEATHVLLDTVHSHRAPEPRAELVRWANFLG